MGKPVLLLRLEGPLQSWGIRSRWDVRDTALEPTKSGVIGLLGCALGYPVHDPRLEQLSDAIYFGVRTEYPGKVATDYQTITDFVPTAAGQYKSRGGVKSLEAIRRDGDAAATIISPRAYLEDAAFLVALEQRNAGDDLLKECAEKLQRPAWPMFLGRKSCIPSRPVFDSRNDGLIDRYDGIEYALKSHPWSWLGACKLPRRQRQAADYLSAWIEVRDDFNHAEAILRQDALRINPARVYGFRAVKRFNIKVSDLQKGDSCSISPN